MGYKRKNETGNIYGDLTVTGFSHVAGQAYWFCECKCGVITIVSGSDLRRGHTKSCGCSRGEKHGHSRCNKRSPEYQSWVLMTQRCRDPNGPDYHRYGGRGIRVCSEWQKSFKQFYADMGQRPGPDYSIDRIDNDGNYEKGNCRWATRMEQAANRQNNTLFTFAGRTQHLAAWCREFGVHPATYKDRRRRGWTPEQSLGQVPE